MQNFRGKNSKDIEAAKETVIINVKSPELYFSRINPELDKSVSAQQIKDEEFEGEMEKRKR
ncbi:MAG: hypothetical protein N2489_09190 [Clostridia bacterium]|nr:hypothetical protein [Clostridia bacterium]